VSWQTGCGLLQSFDIGAGLQDGNFRAQLSASDHGGTVVTVASSNPAVALVSLDATTPGVGSIDVTVAAGQIYANFYIQGVEGMAGSVLITASAPGFVDETGTIDVVQPALEISGLVQSTTVLGVDNPFTVRVGVANAQGTAIARLQQARAGGGGLTASVSNSNAAAAQLVTTAFTGQMVTVGIAEGQFSSASTVAAGGVAFDPLAAGMTQVSATIPGFGSTTAATVSVTVNP